MCVVHSNVRNDVTVDNLSYVDFEFLLKMTHKITFGISAHLVRSILCLLKRTIDARNERPFSRHFA
jgi:hypothetical protein